MMILRHAPVVRVLIPYALGSLAGYAATIEIGLPSLLLLSLSALFAMFLIYFCSGSPRAILHGSFCLVVFILFFVSGVALGRMDRPKDPGLPTGERVIVRGRVKEEPVIRDGRMVFGMELKMASSHDSLFKVPNYIRVYMNQGEGFEAPGAGETWVLCGRLIAFENGGNPGEVDYAFVMRRKNYWYRFYCDTSMVFNRRADEVQSRIPGPAEFRKILSDHWKGPLEKVSLLKALCLGDRSGLSEDLRQSYSQAGGMHILAVSGLHVGLIWWVLHGVLGFMGLFGKREIIRGTIIVLILWFYAYITGFSASVSRSVTMFTFFSLARMINHRGHSVNAILISMFFLLLIQPGIMLDVGFQLSYAAILSIVTLNPLIMGIWRPGNSLVRWIWEASVLSLSAQVGTLPLVIYYFHQVPIYGLLSNLFLIPLLSSIIILFVMTSPLVFLGLGAGITSSVLTMTAGLMNSLVEFISSFPMAVAGGLFIDRVTLIVLMTILFFTIHLLNNKRRLSLYIIITLLCIQAFWSANKARERNESAELQISHFRGGSLLTFREGRRIDHYILAKSPLTVAYMDRYLSTAMGGRCYETSVILLNSQECEYGGTSCALQLKPGIWWMGNNLIRGFIFSGPHDRGVYGILQELNPDFVLISGESLSRLEKMPELPAKLVVDGSNRSWYLSRLKAAGIDFYNTASRGALLIPY